MTTAMTPLTFAYYCSGHGYGHATRVSAVATYLRQMDDAPAVYIVSSAPKHVFELAISSGALYRYAEIDPVIVQPLAYYVDRRKSVDVLKTFLSKQVQKIEEEVAWLKDNAVDCVLSDAAFLACKAANAAHIPSVLITNFTFDSVYSYLSIRFPEDSSLNPNLALNKAHDPKLSQLNDEPISAEELAPLVKELHDGYRCAELLLRLPGNIPLPSFSVVPSLPSYLWTDPERNTFLPDVFASLSRNTSSEELHPSIPFPSTQRTYIPKPLLRRAVQAPLIVRHPSPDIYTPMGRKRMLDSIGVPNDLQSTQTKILVVSFGGQVFRRPRSRTSSRSQSPADAQRGRTDFSRTPSAESTSSTDNSVNVYRPHHAHTHSHCTQEKHKEAFVHVVPPIATESHLWVPGAPPANKSPTMTSASPFQPPQDDNSDINDDIAARALAYADMDTESDYSDSELSGPERQFLPDDSWIAIVCGVTASVKGAADDDDELPTNFFIAPRDVYMPDLTALGDVLLGKLGYGTTAECVDACTPFVFVPRPLFVEEHGLRRLLHNEGAGVELSCERYEAGDWAGTVQEAWAAGREMKARKRAVGEDGERRKRGEKMARQLVEWVREWQLTSKALQMKGVRCEA